LHLATQRLANHDRLLKDTGLTHPYLDEAYLGFIFIYHILRCNRDTLSLVEGFTNLLNEMEAQYPPHQMHIPGYAVGFLASITATESPFEWQGLVAPSLPALTETTGQHLFRYQHGLATIFPSPLIMIDQMIELTATARTAATATRHETFHRVFSQQMGNAAAVRWVTTSVHYALETSNTVRGDTQAFAAYSINQNTAANNRDNFNRNVLDIPAMIDYDAAFNTPATWPQAMGIIDYAHAPNRVDRYRNWPAQYSAQIAFQCQYVYGSRPLSDISTSGLGAHLMIRTYDPAPFPDPATDPNTAARRSARRLQSLTATGSTPDVELEKIATQHSAVAQTNPAFPADVNMPANIMRQGPFWDLVITRETRPFNAATHMFVELPQMISSTKV